MARPLQKKKNKSSLPRVRQKPKSKRLNIKSNPIVAANWYTLPLLPFQPHKILTSLQYRDQHLTLSQNYHRLGLSSKLNAHTGGTEHKVTKSQTQRSALAIPSSKAPKTLGNTEVKVLRDPETGAIISVQPSPSQTQRANKNPLNDPLNDLSASEEEEDADDAPEAQAGIIPQLEESAKWTKRKRPRVQSQREREWCGRLVERWGDDWGGMVRDRRLNPMQQSEGDLRRRVGVWREKGGGGVS